MVPAPVATVNPSPDGADSLVPTPNHGHRFNEDPVTSMEPFEPTPGWTRGNSLWKRAYSAKGNEL